MSDKKKRNLIIVLCVLAIVIAIVAIAFAPFGRKATGNSDSPNITDTETTQAVAVNSSEVASETEATSIPEATESSSTDTTIAIPPSTDPVVNPNKNYTLFIDKTVFDFSEDDDGSMTLTAKENGSVKITITPVRDMSYKQCCRATEKNHKKLNSSANLKIENTNTAYRSQTGDSDSDIITTVYCVDDKKGGCIVIECRIPVGATKYTETIEIMLSMFKVI